MEKDYYTVLGLPQNATSRQVKARFLELARERHPDRFPGDGKEEAELKFQEITQAFNVLSDPVRRRELDEQLARPTELDAHKTNAEAARVYLQRGILSYRRGAMSEAIDNFQRATREDPDNGKAWYHLAQAAQQDPRQKGKARQAIARACELEAMNGDYHALAGKLFAEGGMHARAAKHLKQALDWSGETPELRREFEASLRAAKRK